MSKHMHQERRDVLYSLLLKTDGWQLQEDIAEKMFPTYYSGWDKGHFHESRARVRMTEDIQAINNDPNLEKIIICSVDGIKIASKDDIDGYLKSQYAALFRKLKRIRNIERKASLDGQIKINLKNDNSISFVEALKEAIL